MLANVERIRKLLWQDAGEAALGEARILKEENPNDLDATRLLKEVTEWMSHTISPEAYANFYKAHRRSYFVPERVGVAHEQVPRLGQIRQWMLDAPPKSILDLGCFCGFALNNLCMATGAQGMGVDLDQEALAHAASTATGLGLNVQFAHEMAEGIDLNRQFDAVLIMELLEHVVDPKKLIETAERHLAPGGRIYITTPGTPVPHFDNEQEAREHLRCLSEQGLFDLIGDRVIDGHTVITPASHQERVLCYRRPKTAFLVNPITGGWNPGDPGSYRGSEEAVVCLAHTMAKRGHHVELYYHPSVHEESEEDKRTNVAGVSCIQSKFFNPEEEYDLLFIKKWPQVLDFNVKARAIYFWTTDPNGPADLTPLRLDRITKVVALTEYHQRELEHLNPEIPRDKIIQIPYGIPDNFFSVNDAHKPPSHRMVYASSYDRGLAWLLEKWPEIREAVPDAELYVYYGWTFFDRMAGAFDEKARAWKKDMQEKMKQPGVVERGETTPYDLTPFTEASFWAYPCTGGERFCITGKKAQRMGCIPIVVPTMALDETVNHGYKTDHANYVTAVVTALKDENGKNGNMRQIMVQDNETILRWAQVAELWQQQYQPLFRSPIKKSLKKLSPKRQTLTATFITKNSESMIIRALNSMKSVADEIIFIDQGSTDSTLEIGKRYNVKVFEDNTPFYCMNCKKEMDSNHFAEVEHEPYGFEGPRNTSVVNAQCDWIFWLDTDEELLQPDELAKYLRPNCFNGYAIRQHHFSAVPPNAFKADLPVRCFRNGVGARFFGKVHEHPELILNQGITPAIILTDVDIAHDGYLIEAGRRQKFSRNIGLMRADRRKYPHRMLGKFLWLRDLIHLTRYSVEQSGGRLTRDAIGFCEEAIQLFEAEFLGNMNMYATDGLDYYSEALRILNKGFEVNWSMNAAPSGAEVGEVKRARFSSVDAWQKALKGQSEGVVGQFQGKYV